MSQLLSAQLGFCMPGHPGTPENRRNRPCEFWRVLLATWPIASGMGSRSGPSSQFKEEDDLNSEDAEVHSGVPRSWCTLFTVL